MGAIYFHIPFCKRLCGYCDFVRSVKSRFMPQTVEAMHRELEQQVGFLKDRKIRTIYFGGGTPSLLHPSEIERFIEHCRALFDCSETEEITVEVNPDDITESYAEAIAATSVNRVSMGVQSFDDSCLQFMGRRHSAEGANFGFPLAFFCHVGCLPPSFYTGSHACLRNPKFPFY